MVSRAVLVCLSVLFPCTIILAPISRISADNWNMELVSRDARGPAYDVHTVGNYSYLCTGAVLVILDVSVLPEPWARAWPVAFGSGLAH
jgi:hypothetical protein